MEAANKVLSFSVILKFRGGNPSLYRIREVIAGWALKGAYSVGIIDSRHSLLYLTEEEDMRHALAKEVYKIDGVLFRKFKWTSDFDPRKESRAIPIWVQLHNLPLPFFVEPFLSGIASTIGTYLRSDIPTNHFLRPKLARICVEVDTARTLPQEIWIGTGEHKGFLQKITYESLPSYCTFCNLQGHTKENCRRFAQETGKDKDKSNQDAQATTVQNSAAQDHSSTHIIMGGNTQGAEQIQMQQNEIPSSNISLQTREWQQRKNQHPKPNHKTRVDEPRDTSQANRFSLLNAVTIIPSATEETSLPANVPEGTPSILHTKFATQVKSKKRVKQKERERVANSPATFSHKGNNDNQNTQGAAITMQAAADIGFAVGTKEPTKRRKSYLSPNSVHLHLDGIGLDHPFYKFPNNKKSKQQIQSPTDQTSNVVAQTSKGDSPQLPLTSPPEPPDPPPQIPQPITKATNPQQQQHKDSNVPAHVPILALEAEPLLGDGFQLQEPDSEAEEDFIIERPPTNQGQARPQQSKGVGMPPKKQSGNFLKSRSGYRMQADPKGHRPSNKKSIAPATESAAPQLKDKRAMKATPTAAPTPSGKTLP